MYDNGSAPLTITGFAYDYMIKDHLGNTRAVLTDERKTTGYIPATMESAMSLPEEEIFTNITNTRIQKPAGYPTDTYTNPNEKVAVVRGDCTKDRTGYLYNTDHLDHLFRSS